MNRIINNELPNLVALITREMTSRQDKKDFWASFKRHYNVELCKLLGVNPNWGVQAGALISFDIDSDRKLVLLNYSPTAHNLLHEIEDGWSPQLRGLRGLVYAYDTPGDASGVRLVSRGFEKFFNQSELPETSMENLMKDAGNETLLCTSKEDGHMIEYFIHKRQLCATTRGKLGTPSADASLSMINRVKFIKAQVIAKRYGYDLMTLVCEFIHPMTRVHVDYGGSEKLFLLEAYDKKGDVVSRKALWEIATEMSGVFSLTQVRHMTVLELDKEINDRSVMNREGWVAMIPTSDGSPRRVKFKYINYIGEMVKSKLSYKYLMNCIKNDRLDYMLITLPEEIRAVAYGMVDEITKLTHPESYASLYDLHSLNEGGRDYFRTVCREYWRHIVAK
jgi:hypothetical protein